MLRHTRRRLSSYSHTLNLPKTTFPLRARAAEREVPLVERLASDTYAWQAKARASAPTWTLHDGPPYANGSLHMGHALNKILKDTINRYKLLRGFRVRFRPGWDCHGLPIELKAKAAKAAGDDPLAVREAAAAFASGAIAEQREEFRRWGVMGDWEGAYTTMQPEYEARQLELFGQMADKGLLTRGLKPVHWSPSSRTALAEAELEYADRHVSQAVYVDFHVTDLPAAPPSVRALIPLLWLAVWTTTPWTLPANQAVCYAEAAEYSVVRVDVGAPRFVLVASDLVESLFDGMEVVTTIPGSALAGGLYSNPLAGVYMSEGSLPLLPAAHVTTDSGTGLVHTAPGHGVDDFHACRAHGIDRVACPVDARGRFTAEVAPLGLEGLDVLREGTDACVELLRKRGVLRRHDPQYEHRYPYDWRTGQPVIFRATTQWFARLDPLKAPALEALRGVRFHPAAGRARLQAFVSTRSEWCVSRQRAWGVPIPAMYRRDTGEPLLVAGRAAQLARERGGAGSWWTAPAEDLLPPGHSPDDYVRGTDTMDVWFDSGSSWHAANGGATADLCLEGSDQHRGWFQSSLLTSAALRGAEAPYRAVVTHGFVLDGDRAKMSKSRGNTVEPRDVVAGKRTRHGADVLRLWAASCDYTRDVPAGDTVVAAAAQASRKHRSTLRFMMGCLHDFDRDRDAVPRDALHPADRYLLHLLAGLERAARAAYDEYNFVRVHQLVHAFETVDLSAFYFEVCKDRLYIDAPGSRSRRACQTALAEALRVLTMAMAPVLCFTAEDAFDHMGDGLRGALGAPPGARSVFEAPWPECPPEWRDDALAADWAVTRAVRGGVNRAAEQARRDEAAPVATPLELRAEVAVPAAGAVAGALARVAPADAEAFPDLGLAEVLLVAEAGVRDAGGGGAAQWSDESEVAGERVRVSLERVGRRKCPRCWIFRAEADDALCARCSRVVATL